jgi:hypothetical protein
VLFRSRGARLSRPLAVLLAALRVVALLLGLQLSGTAHAVTDAVASIVLHHATHEDACPADGSPCDDCPPSCPNCHCSNAPVAMPPLELPSPHLFAAGGEAVIGLTSADAPPRPELPLPFRPPRNVVRAS